MVYNAEPEITKTFKFIEKPGYLPAAAGSFNIPSENIIVDVSSNLIKEKTEYVNTSIRIISKELTISTGFSSKTDDQLSFIQLNSYGVILCTAK
jgi:hypothetical protein